MLDIRSYVTLPDAPSVHLSYYSVKRGVFTHACTLKVATAASCLQRNKRTQAQGKMMKWRSSQKFELSASLLHPPRSAVPPSALGHTLFQASASHLQNRCGLSGHVSLAAHPPPLHLCQSGTLGFTNSVNLTAKQCQLWIQRERCTGMSTICTVQNANLGTTDV